MDSSFEKLINRVLDSRYKIENVVGIGGMAYVLKAIDLKQNNRPVAIKILSQEFNSDESSVKRFVNESKAVAMIDSPNVVKIYDVAITDSLKYIVMEFIDGITLKDYMDKVGALGWREAVHYVRQILDALSAAHQKGIIHRDIKPQNVMLLRDGKVKVTDFGIAKTPTSEPLTMTDKAIGTVNYISPEQASGKKVDEKSDLYSVGVMLYEMLTGVLPFTAESPVAVAMMQVSQEPKSPREINPQIPVGLEQIVIKAMSKDPSDRFGNASSMEKALEYFVKNPAVVFSGVPTNTGATEEERKIRMEKDREEKQRERQKKHRSMFPIILGITFAFFTVIAISMAYLWNLSGSAYEEAKNKDREPHEMVSVSGMSFADRFAIFVDYMLGVEGNNSEERKIVIEDYVGKEYTPELQAAIEEMGFIIVENRNNYEKDKPYNQILRQDPKGGRETIDPKEGGKVTLTLHINNYTEEVYTMPDCIGYREAQAKSTILRALFDLFITEDNLEIIEEYCDEEGVAKGQVIKTLPEPQYTFDVENIPDKIIVYISKGPTPEELKMPDVKGLTKEEVKALLEENNIKYTIETEYNDEIEAGKAVRTSIEADTTYMSDEELEVVVYFSDGKDPAIPMPVCVGLATEEAIATVMNSLGISRDAIQVIEVFNDSVTVGTVYKSFPTEGTTLMNPAATSVALYVSKGAEVFESLVPSVINETVENAKERLYQAGFTEIQEIPAESQAAKGTVISTNVNAGNIVKTNTPIILYVSEGPKTYHPQTPAVNPNTQNPNVNYVPPVNQQTVPQLPVEELFPSVTQDVPAENVPSTEVTDAPVVEQPPVPEQPAVTPSAPVDSDVLVASAANLSY